MKKSTKSIIVALLGIAGILIEVDYRYNVIENILTNNNPEVISK